VPYTGNSIIVDGCTNEFAIAQLFTAKYRSLYNCVSFDKDAMQHILNELHGKVCAIISYIILIVALVIVTLV